MSFHASSLQGLWHRLCREGLVPLVAAGGVVLWLLLSALLGAALPLPEDTLYTAGVRTRVRELQQAEDEVASLAAHLVRLQELWRRGGASSPLDAVQLAAEVYGSYYRECSVYTAAACHAVMAAAEAGYAHVVSTDSNAGARMGNLIAEAWRTVQTADRQLRQDPLSRMGQLRQPLHPQPVQTFDMGVASPLLTGDAVPDTARESGRPSGSPDAFESLVRRLQEAAGSE